MAGRVRCAVLVTWALLLVASAKAAPPPEGSDDWRELSPYRDWVITRENSLGGRCCDEADGRPVEAVVEGDHWKVHITPQHWPREADRWMVVPNNRVLHEPNPVGAAILWLNPYTHRPNCFLPAAGA